MSEVLAQTEAVATLDRAARRADHQAWWHAFWARSWIHVHDRAPTPPLATRAPLRLGDGPCGSSRWQGTLHEVRLARGAAPVATWTAPEIGLHPDVDASPGEDLTITLRVRTPPRDDGGFLCCWTTPDRADGLLIDTEPCIPVPPAVVLRITRGDRRWITPQVLRPDTDHLIVVTIVGGVASLILDGVPVPLREPDPATPGHDVAQGYALQRFLTACAGRGAFPIKFNGSLFTVGWDGRPGDADYRRWGPGYWWQNSRLPYLAACTAGDDELLEPFFRMCDDVLAVSRHRTQRYFGIDGAYLPECVYTWGAVFMESYGWAETAAQRTDKLQVSGYHKREWVAGLELAWMQLERFDHTGNTAEFHRRILPTALAVLRFFDGYYRPGPDGRLVMHPAQALEMWWDVTNPAPEIAGLQAVTERLLALPDALVPAADRAWLAAFRQRIPDLPVAEVDGHRLLTAAGAIHSPKRNVEHPELYAVFPFRRITAGHPDAPLAVEALRRRLDRGCYGWRQDDLFMAGLGLAREARDGLVSRARQRSPCRFPAFWGPNFDWTPDQDHGGVLMRTIQQMLLQTDGRRIRLLPAWPQEWDVDFRLHAPFGTVITGRVEGGTLASWTITPSERAADVEVGVPS
jgi:hypothetical protein